MERRHRRVAQEPGQRLIFVCNDCCLLRRIAGTLRDLAPPADFFATAIREELARLLAGPMPSLIDTHVDGEPGWVLDQCDDPELFERAVENNTAKVKEQLAKAQGKESIGRAKKIARSMMRADAARVYQNKLRGKAPSHDLPFSTSRPGMPAPRLALATA
jgi:hypothetical protein